MSCNVVVVIVAIIKRVIKVIMVVGEVMVAHGVVIGVLGVFIIRVAAVLV